MLKRFAIIGGILVSSLLVAGCDDDDDAPATIPVTELEDTYLDFMCQKLISCNTEGFAVMLGTVDNCRTFIEMEGDNMFAKTVDAINAGDVLYDAEAAATCLNAMEAGSCQDMVADRQYDVCQSVFIGTVADGGACEIDEECLSGACELDYETCMGTCATVVAAGGACEAWETYCEKGTTCYDGICQAYTAPLGSGDSCDPDAENDWCDWDFYCNYDSSTCMARGGAGDACDGDDECEHGLSCDYGDGENGVCAEVAVLDAGDECEPEGSSMCNYFEGYACQITVVNPQTEEFEGTCQPMVQLGDTCWDAEAMTMTACDIFEDIFCDMSEGYLTDAVCVSKKAAGADCEESNECLSDYCDWETNTCAEDMMCK